MASSIAGRKEVRKSSPGSYFRSSRCRNITPVRKNRGIPLDRGNAVCSGPVGALWPGDQPFVRTAADEIMIAVSFWLKT